MALRGQSSLCASLSHQATHHLLVAPESRYGFTSPPHPSSLTPVSLSIDSNYAYGHFSSSLTGSPLLNFHFFDGLKKRVPA